MPTVPSGGGLTKARPLIRPAPTPAAPLTGEPEQARFNAEVEGSVRGITSCPLLSGRVVVVGALSTDVTRVPHGLGRVPVGWFPVQKTGNSDVWEGRAADSEALYLVATTTEAEFSLWVF